MIAELVNGFEIKVIENQAVQRGTAILMVHPDDFERLSKERKEAVSNTTGDDSSNSDKQQTN